MNCVIEMAGQTQHFLVILLLSLLISVNAVCASRAAIMVHLGQDFPASQAAHQKNQPLQKLSNGRMDLQYGDYPVSAANPRHTPKPPPGRV